MLCYLAGAVDAVAPPDARSWREHASIWLERCGIGTYSPPHAFHVPSAIGAYDTLAQRTELHQRVIAINLYALEQADLVLANLEAKSFGTPLEVEHAKCPVFGFGLHTASIYAHFFYRLEPTLDFALKQIQEWHDGVHALT